MATGGIGASTEPGGSTTTCASVLPGSSAIDLGSQGFVYPFTSPANTVNSTISATASGSSLFTVNQFNGCTSNTLVSAALQEEVDLPALRERLTDVMEETVQPAHVSLWLREAPQDQPR